MKANGKSGFSFFKKVIKNLLLTILVFVPLVSYLGTSLFIEARSPVDKDPYVHWSGLDPHTEVFVSWETSEKLDSVVEYGTTPDLEEKTSITQEHQMHRIKLSGLSPGKKYYYQASDSSGVYLSPVQYFFTAPLSNSGNAKSFNVTFISDTQQLFGTGHWNTIARSIAQFEDSAFLSIAGDVGQEEEDQDTWNFFWKHAAKLTNKLPLITVPGNHDDPDNNESLYFKYFGNTTNELDCFYSFNWSNAQFVMMEIANAGDTNPNEATDNFRAYEWLNKTLEAGMAMQYRILVFHRQVFSSLGNDESLMKYVIPIIEKYNVSLTLYGHMHEYARYYHNGHNYICLGGGGGMQNSYIETQNITQKSAMGASFTKLYFTEEKITIKTFSPTYDVMDNIVLNFKNGMMVPEKITTYGGL